MEDERIPKKKKDSEWEIHSTRFSRNIKNKMDVTQRDALQAPGIRE
jgi:hypothetical protein